jgi:hypothetical protein
VKNNSLIPQVELAQSTAFMDWKKIEWIAFSDAQQAEGKLFSPQTNKLQTVSASLKNKKWIWDNKTTTKNFSIKNYIEISRKESK